MSVIAPSCFFCCCFFRIPSVVFPLPQQCCTDCCLCISSFLSWKEFSSFVPRRLVEVCTHTHAIGAFTSVNFCTRKKVFFLEIRTRDPIPQSMRFFTTRPPGGIGERSVVRDIEAVCYGMIGKTRRNARLWTLVHMYRQPMVS